MKAYLVTKGEYSDYRVAGVFLRKEDAELYIATRKPQSIYDGFNDIQEIEVHEGPVGQVTFWQVEYRWSKTGKNEFCEWSFIEDEGYYPEFEFRVMFDTAQAKTFRVTGTDKERAYKVLQDKRAEILARESGLT